MISSLRGVVEQLRSDAIVLDVNGVGYGVWIPAQLASQIRTGQEIKLHTSLIVREDSMTLYGFESLEQLELFSVLLGVSGVGPKSALGIISAITPDDLAVAVAEQDEKPFRKVSGIGPKTAKLILLQLQGKILASADSPLTVSVESKSIRAELVAALVSLGWNEKHSELAAEAALSQAPEPAKTQLNQLLRLALAKGAGVNNG